MTDVGDYILVFGLGKNLVNQIHDPEHILLYKAAGCDGRGADADTGGLERAAAVERDHVLVHGDVGLDELVLGEPAGQVRELGAANIVHSQLLDADMLHANQVDRL